LKTTRCFTGNQCKRDRTGEMRRLVPVRSRVAAITTPGRRHKSYFEPLYHHLKDSIG